MIIKQEPGELPQQVAVPAAGAVQPSVQQYITVKGSHMLALSPQKPVVSTGEGTVQPKVQGTWVSLGCWELSCGGNLVGSWVPVCRVARVLHPCSAWEGSRLSRH